MTRISFKSLSGASLNVDYVKGSTIPVLALHGFTGNLSTWDNLRRAAPGGSFVLLDLLGHGLSDSPTDPLLYHIEQTLNMLSELLDQLGIPKVHWLGYSMGGRIALVAALSLPERTTSLILESASPGLATPEDRQSRIDSDASLAQMLESQGITEFVNYWEALPLWKSQARLSPAIKDQLRVQRLANNPLGLANSLRGIGTGAQPPLYDRLAELRVRSLLIAGAEDSKYALIARQMHLAVPSSRVRIIPESGHTVHLEQPEVFNRAVMEFLAGIEPPANPRYRNADRRNP